MNVSFKKDNTVAGKRFDNVRVYVDGKWEYTIGRPDLSAVHYVVFAHGAGKVVLSPFQCVEHAKRAVQRYL